jgi:hypothetical protein
VLLPPGIEPVPHISVALMAQYLNVHQRNLGNIYIQTVHILQHNSADTGSMKDFLKHNPSYFKITQPGSCTASEHLRNTSGGIKKEMCKVYKR